MLSSGSPHSWCVLCVLNGRLQAWYYPRASSWALVDEGTSNQRERSGRSRAHSSGLYLEY